MTVTLRQLTVCELHAIAAHGASAFAPAGVVHPGALPPPFVMQRAAAMVAAGAPAFWWIPFVVVQARDGAAVGGCAFKGEPKDGRVEVLYGIAKDCRGRGFASAAIAQLAAAAFERGAAEVLAEIEPRNLASIRTVQRCGFERLSARTAEDGVRVEQWLLVAREAP